MIKSVQIKVLIIFVAIFIVVAIFPRAITQAGFDFPFGGRVTNIMPCSCNGIGSQVTITGGYFSGTYLYDQMATRKYRNFIMSPGRWVMGRYTAGGECFQAPPPCAPLPITKGTVTFFGASL